MTYSAELKKIKRKIGKEKCAVAEGITAFDDLQLAKCGSDDEEGYQVFTDWKTVGDMVAAVGADILDFSKTVLEPTSGDGAFTTYILKKRLETIGENADLQLEALLALSTIYSIEIDEELIKKQRNNIFTVIARCFGERGITADTGYYDLVKCMIAENFIWGMFNSEDEFGALINEVAYRMPIGNNVEKEAVLFPKWKIGDEGISFEYEEVDTW